jgi:putative membrane protein
MLIDLLAHGEQAPTPHHLWTAWNPDPILLLVIAAVVWAYVRGRRGRSKPGPWRGWCFAGALVTVVIALVSPLEAASDALASAHMVQHVLLLLVAAPLLVLAAPFGTLLRGISPKGLRALSRSRRVLRLTRANLRVLGDPVVVWLLHVGVLWFWHAAVPYDAALDSHAIHIAEHASFIITAVLFWRAVLSSRVAGSDSGGFGVLLVFAMGIQSVFLSALLTFARTPWYTGYEDTPRAWGLEQLADQQLAGVIMWVPAGMIYVSAALALLVGWLHGMERDDAALLVDTGSAAGSLEDP